jgi:type II secretory ATPase GspE/PulE/Tfp pilus assembly ATPase PilB-like protein
MEILTLTDRLREAVLRKELKLIEDLARQDGYKTMREHAAERVLTGDTSVRELIANCPV